MRTAHLALPLLLLCLSCGGGNGSGATGATMAPAPPPVAAPVANAGSNQTVASGASVTHDGSASVDPNGLPLTYAWSAPGGITLSSTTVAKPTFTAPTVAAGQSPVILPFSLVVSDGQASSTASSVLITVNPATSVNTAPSASAGPNQSVNSSAAVALDGSLSHDPEGQALTYAWTQATGATVTLAGANTAHPTFTAPAVPSGSPAITLTFSLVVSDGLANSIPATVSITVNPVVVVNPDPIASAGPNQSVNSSAAATLDGSLSYDPDGQALTYAWTQTAGAAVTLTGANTAHPTFTAPTVPSGSPAMTLTFSLVVSDAQANSVPALVSITVNPVVAANPAPIASAGPDQSVASAAAVLLDGSLSFDPDGQPLTYAWTQATGPIVTLTGSGTAHPTFTAPAVASGSPALALSFSLVVSDANANSAASTVSVTVNPAAPLNADPIANAGPNQSVASGAAVALDGSQSFDPDGQPLTYAWTQASGTTVALAGASTAHPIFTAPTVASGAAALTLTFALVASDANANSVPATVSVTVNPSGGTAFPPPPGTPAPAPADPNPLPVGGSGSKRWQIGAVGGGVYLVDPAAGEATVQGMVIVTLDKGFPPSDTLVTLNGVALVHAPLADNRYFLVDPNGPQPPVKPGGRMALVASSASAGVQRQLVLPCASDVAIGSNPAVGASLAGVANLQLTFPSDLTLNATGIVALAGTSPSVMLGGYDPATRVFTAGSPHAIGAGQLSVTFPVGTTSSTEWLLDLRWPGLFIADGGDSGAFCGLAKRWTYAK